MRRCALIARFSKPMGKGLKFEDAFLSCAATSGSRAKSAPKPLFTRFGTLFRGSPSPVKNPPKTSRRAVEGHFGRWEGSQGSGRWQPAGRGSHPPVMRRCAFGLDRMRTCALIVHPNPRRGACGTATGGAGTQWGKGVGRRAGGCGAGPGEGVRGHSRVPASGRVQPHGERGAGAESVQGGDGAARLAAAGPPPRAPAAAPAASPAAAPVGRCHLGVGRPRRGGALCTTSAVRGPAAQPGRSHRPTSAPQVLPQGFLTRQKEWKNTEIMRRCAFPHPRFRPIHWGLRGRRTPEGRREACAGTPGLPLTTGD